MQKVIDKKYLFLGLFLALLLSGIIIVCSLVLQTKTDNPQEWIIRSYENTVVLMNNGEVVEVFGNIVVDTLPDEDKKHLESGISFSA